MLWASLITAEKNSKGRALCFHAHTLAYLQELAVWGIQVTRVGEVQERPTDHQVPHHCGHVWGHAQDSRVNIYSETIDCSASTQTGHQGATEMAGSFKPEFGVCPPIHTHT